MNDMNPRNLWTRRQILQGGAAAGLGAALMPRLNGAQASRERPNILWIMADDMGYADLSFTGQRAFTTPNIDRIAREGLFLHQSYANSAVCSATRTGLITGRYQGRLRVGLEEPIGSASDTIGLDPSHPTLPSLLRDHGYRTSLVGKWHLGFSSRFGPLHSGYQSFYGVPFGAADYFRHRASDPIDATGKLHDGDQPSDDQGYLTDLFSRRAVREIHAGKNDARPFFLSLHYTSPHWPWEGPEDAAVAATLGNNLQHRDGGNLETYKRMVQSMDRGVGEVLKALDAIGAARDTIVIFTSDNGGERFSDTWPFIGLKGELLEGGIRVPMFVRWPARIKAGQRSEQVNMSMDWVPTLLAAAGTQPHPDYPSDGMNLLDVVTARASVVPRQLYWRYKASTQSAMRDGDWKYFKVKNNEYLFNLAQDERERANLSRREPARLTAMQQQWAAWNATMLPYPQESVAYGNTGADRY
jgi:arylsulfatase A-like enzyme